MKSLTSVCHYCGAAKTDFQSWEGYQLDLISNLLIGPFEGSVYFGQTEAVIVYMLLRAQGKYVRTETLIQGVWGSMSGDIAAPANTISVHIAKIRAKLKRTQLRIPDNRGHRIAAFHMEIEACIERSEGTRGPLPPVTGMLPTAK